MSFALLDAHLKKLESLEHAMSILRVDEATQMPTGDVEKRAEAVAALASMHHEQATAPEVGDWIATAEAEELSEDQRAAVREVGRGGDASKFEHQRYAKQPLRCGQCR